ncbi:FadR/GntR family transcriptional regulator [Cupriavidus agavae]|uniref:GntR family transcriptional regulator n=1 Tax=Cupriavidus agavae TaxID=1001822 RepID=A0A4Q7S8R4_9BURK|nr:FadR/GntR family transcriptional regulator [Cupriavidus agavae]RZT42158.1 GntR family transcriptional regulator [Cupriavidus agavae]
MQPRPTTLTERVTQQLRAEIADGTFPVGARLPTGKQLCERFGVSAAVIREATEHLRSQGMIESRQGLGSTVRSRVSDNGFRLAGGTDAADLAAIFELRIDLESAAAGMAARHRTDDDVMRMAALLDELAAHLDDPERGVESDIQFHVAVATATHNPYYLQLLQYMNLQLHHAVQTARVNSSQHPGLPRQVHGEHMAIFHAIRSRDAYLARQQAGQHLRNAAHRLGLKLRAA